MTFNVTNQMGEMFTDPSSDVRSRVLDELEEHHDAEHPDVSLTHESEWCLSIFPGGLVVWENVELDVEPRHLEGLTRSKVEALWTLLSMGDVSTIERDAWRPGYGR